MKTEDAGWSSRRRLTAPPSATSRVRPLVSFCLLPSAFYLLSAFCLLPSARAQSSPQPPQRSAISFDTYSLVRTRNVFDPDRRPLVKREGTPAPAPIQQSDYAALTGTMLDAGKTLAFFSGSRAEFNKVLSVRDSIAKATITKIDGAGVELDRDGRKIVVGVGQTVPLDGSAPTAAPAPQPVVAAAAAAVSTAATAANPVSQAAAPAAAASRSSANSGGAATGNVAPADTARLEEIKKRMMEKRKQDGLQ